jgi:hypothetical protein
VRSGSRGIWYPVAFLLLFVEASSADPLFWAPLAYDTESGTSRVVAGDLNRDPYPDLVVLRSTVSSASVFLGHSNGTLTAETTLHLGWSPGSAAIGDLNGDALPDLVITEKGTASVRVFPGTGTGGFGNPLILNVGAVPNSVAIADLSSDGRPDLAVANQGSGTISILINNGSGGFASLDPVPVGTARSVAIADLNGDSFRDLAVAGSSLVSILLGNGDGTFQPAATLGTGVGVWVEIADLNTDGDADLVAASATSVFLLLGNGDGTFQGAVDLMVAFDSNVEMFRIADINGDAKADLVIAAGRIVRVHGNGDGTFQEAVRYEELWTSSTLDVADFNRDGRLDLAVVPSDNYGLPGLVLLFNAGGGALPAPRRYPAGYLGGDARIADVNGDSRPDVIQAATSSSTVNQNVFVLLGNGDGTLQAARTFDGGYANSVAAADWNGDSRLDLALASHGSATDSGVVAVALGNGDGTFQLPSARAIGRAPQSVVAADFNEDSHVDIAFTRKHSDSVYVLLGNGDATFPVTNVVAIGGPGSVVVVADLNADLHADVVSSNGTILLGRGDGTFASPPRAGGLGFPPATEALGVPVNIAVADLNGDASPDVATVWSESNSIHVGLGNGDGTFRPAVASAVGFLPTSIVVADFTGDGAPDLAAWNPGKVAVLVGGGDGTFSDRRNYYVDSYCTGLAAADLNGDGRPELLVSDAAFEVIVVLLNSGIAGTTESLLSYFKGRWTPSGLELSWRLNESDGHATFELTRSTAAGGPWETVAVGFRAEGETWTVLDSGALPGSPYFYRLTVTRHDGQVSVFGPILVRAGGTLAGPALVSVAPSPTQGRVRIEYTLAYEAPVRLALVDVQGRQVARCVDGIRPAGRHQVVWDGVGAAGTVPAGVYFVRFEIPGFAAARRFVLMR